MNNRIPLVSVVMPAYNHEKYISQAIEGVISQITNFDFELIIGEDCSTDNTKLTCLKYLEQYKDKIVLLAHKQNLGYGGSKNFIEILKVAKGRYIAICEGDDYWNDENKLQKQVDFLEANQDFVICHHNVMVIYEDEVKESHLSNPEDQKEVTTIEDLAKYNYIFTVSCIFRNRNIIFPDWYNTSPVGDYVLHLLNAQYGKIKYFPDVMGVYRIHKGGTWGNTGYENMLSKWIKMQDNLIGMFDSNVNEIILNSQLLNFIDYYNLHKKSGSKNEFQNYYPKSYSLMVEYYEDKIKNMESVISSILNSTEFKVGKFILTPIKRIFRK